MLGMMPVGLSKAGHQNIHPFHGGGFRLQPGSSLLKGKLPCYNHETTREKKRKSSLVLLITRSQTESVQPNGHLHEGLSGFLGNQRFSDQSHRLKKQTLREWFVLEFCGRHLTKKKSAGSYPDLCWSCRGTCGPPRGSRTLLL